MPDRTRRMRSRKMGRCMDPRLRGDDERPCHSQRPSVIPLQKGIQFRLRKRTRPMGSRFRGNDKSGRERQEHVVPKDLLSFPCRRESNFDLHQRTRPMGSRRSLPSNGLIGGGSDKRGLSFPWQRESIHAGGHVEVGPAECGCRVRQSNAVARASP